MVNRFWLDFENKVAEWESVVEDNEEEEEGNALITCSPDHTIGTATVLLKMIKLKSYKVGVIIVFTPVKDVGQARISTRWIFTRKEMHEKTSVKTRLVARSFQDVDAEIVRTDSPTCLKEGLRIVLATIASNRWTCTSMDVKTAFLQGRNLERPVYLTPLPEACAPEGCLWKLTKCVYGLCDASRSWYLTIKEVLLNLGAEVSKYDQAVFSWYHEGKLHDVISTHVDYFCWAGTKLFLVNVIDQIKKQFVIKSEEVSDFKYVGLNVKQNDRKIRISQDEYVKNLRTLPVDNMRSVEEKISEVELTNVRKLIGQLNWMATQTRPDLSYDVNELSSCLADKKLKNIKCVNKAVKKAKKEKSQLVIPDLGNLNKLQILAFSDASFMNLNDGGSQGGYVIFLVGDNGNYMA